MEASRQISMTRDELAYHLRSSGTALLCSADHRVQAIDAPMLAVCTGACIAGPATTARAKPDDNAAVHRAVHAAGPGDVLVIDGGQDRTRAMFGDILADACRRKGIAGVIVRGAVRDVASLRAIGFPVWSTSIHSASAAKTWPGEVNVPISWGDIDIRPGDWIVADDDGVVTVPSNCVARVIPAAAAHGRKEEAIRARIARGESTCAIFDIDP